LVWLPRWGCDGMITSAQKLLMARAGVSVSNTISFVASTGRSNITPTSSLALPEGIEVGDIVIAASMQDSGTPFVPTGYTLGQVGSTSSVGYMWAYKTMADPVDTEIVGLKDDTYTTHMAMVFRGSSSSPSVSTPPAINVVANGMPNPPSVAAGNGNMVVALGFLDDTSAPAQEDFLPPTGYTFGAASSGVACSVMGAYLAITASDTYDPDAFSGIVTSEPSVGATFVLS